MSESVDEVVSNRDEMCGNLRFLLQCLLLELREGPLSSGMFSVLITLIGEPGMIATLSEEILLKRLGVKRDEGHD